MNKHEGFGLVFDKRRLRIKQCPCGRSNRDGKFVPYMGYDDKGYCHSCERTFFPEAPEQQIWVRPAMQKAPEIHLVSYIERQILNSTLRGYAHNHLTIFLKSLFGEEVAGELLKIYYIGTSKKWPGATVFWQVDLEGNIRTGKIMLYSPSTGKRIKEPYPCFSYAHTALKIAEFNLKQCLFGEHLLKDKNKPVAIAESEKTAVIASQYLPQYIWLASGGATGLTVEKCRVLADRNIILFPDLTKPGAEVNCYELWSQKAEEFNCLIPGSFFQVSDLLENKTTAEDRQQGLDLADYLVRFNFADFLQRQAPEQAGSKLGNEVTLQEEATSQQAQWNKLARKYPNLNILQERLGLEILCYSVG
jgi:hypothetical protein